MPKNKTEVKVCSREYTIVSEESSEYVNRVAFYVDNKITELNRAYVGLSTVMATTLAALNIADELLKSREALSDAEDELEKLRELVRDMEIASRVRGDGDDEAKRRLDALKRENKALKDKIETMELENNALKQRDKRVTNLDGSRKAK